MREIFIVKIHALQNVYLIYLYKLVNMYQGLESAFTTSILITFGNIPSSQVVFKYQMKLSLNYSYKKVI